MTIQKHRGWDQKKQLKDIVRQQESPFLRGGGDGEAKGLSAIREGGQTAISLRPDVDGTGPGSLLDSILSTLLKRMIQALSGW